MHLLFKSTDLIAIEQQIQLDKIHEFQSSTKNQFQTELMAAISRTSTETAYLSARSPPCWRNHRTAACSSSHGGVTAASRPSLRLPCL